MPTYEYRCPKGHDFERFYKTISSAATRVECPECGEVAARVMSAGGGLLFKGSGFYLTDYGKNAHRGGSKPASASESVSPKSEGGKAEGGKAEGGKAEGGKSEGPGSAKPDSAKTESAKPAKAPAKPKSE